MSRTALLFVPALLLGACDDPGPGDGDCDNVQILINEALVDAAGDDEGFEWVELTNAGGDEVDLTNYYIGWQKSADSTGESVGFPEGTTLAPGEYLLVGEAEVADRDVEVDLDLGQGTSGDGVFLFNACAAPVDALVYGDSNDDSITDESGGKAVSYAPKPGSGESLARCPDGQDSDDPGADFLVMGEEAITPGAANVCPELTLASDVEIVVNEVMVDPEGSDSGLEWIELENTGSQDAHLDLWVIEYFKSDPLDGSELQIPAGTLLPAGSRLVIGDENVPFTADLTMTLSFGNGDEGDAIHLYDGQGTLEDAVVYGGSNEDGMLDEGGTATSIAPDPGSDESLARCPDGEDSDLSGEDFAVCMVAGGTPGAPNDACCGGGDACDEAGSATLVINEFLANPDSTDAGNEWVEIYNASGGAVDVSGWQIAWFKSDPASASDSVGLPQGTLIPARGFLLIGDENVAGADVQATLDMGNGSDGDALHLLDCAGTLEDAVVYGGSNEDGMFDEGGLATSVAPSPGDDEALARHPDGEDSDRSGNDFCVESSHTPGAANSACAD